MVGRRLSIFERTAIVQKFVSPVARNVDSTGAHARQGKGGSALIGHFILDNVLIEIKTTGGGLMNDATATDQLPIQIAPADRLLTAAEFQRLAGVPREVECFANLGNAYTRRSDENAVKHSVRLARIFRPEEATAMHRQMMAGHSRSFTQLRRKLNAEDAAGRFLRGNETADLDTDYNQLVGPAFREQLSKLAFKRNAGILRQ